MEDTRTAGSKMYGLLRLSLATADAAHFSRLTPWSRALTWMSMRASNRTAAGDSTLRIHPQPAPVQRNRAAR
eukprot:7376660-Prymnesium_polylepis.1